MDYTITVTHSILLVSVIVAIIRLDIKECKINNNKTHTIICESFSLQKIKPTSILLVGFDVLGNKQIISLRTVVHDEQL